MQNSEYLNVIAEILGVVGGIAGGLPTVGALGAIGSVAVLVSTLIKQGEAGAERLKQLNGELQGMVAAGRNPTEAEFTALKSRSDIAHRKIQSTGP